MILFHRDKARSAKSSVSIYKNPWKTYKSNFSYKHLHLIIYSQDSTRQYRIAASTSVNIRTNDDVGDIGCVSISKFVSLKAFLQHSPSSSSTLYEISFSYHSLILLRTICPHTLHPSRDKIRSCSSVARRENNPLRRKHRTWCSKRETNCSLIRGWKFSHIRDLFFHRIFVSMDLRYSKNVAPFMSK